jgi:hypothetical protein
MKYFLLLVLSASLCIFLLAGCDATQMRVVDKFVVDRVQTGAVDQYIIKTTDDDPRYIDPSFRVKFSLTINNHETTATCSISEATWNLLSIGYTFSYVVVGSDVDCVRVVTAINQDMESHAAN